ncbi:LPXTG cell wall anchor domain-containing protein [Lacticaseibacillus daqingensis]|uniref:LPXTG cell wall anchor domain-containing protein n=1 Tax=Lacticaseibacillus daqingensis TaxID=2486014 RepID=UPI000F781C7A|nr:LPXTG cell wall anchor domain-containing protein [Lacticaseibacillus daqingensis]
MKDRNGAKKLYKAHKTWLAAGVVAAGLFSIQVLGQPTAHVRASETAEATTTTVPVSIQYVVRDTNQTVGSFTLQAQVGQSYDDLQEEVTANLPAGYALARESLFNTNDDGFVVGQTYTKTYYVTPTGEPTEPVTTTPTTKTITITLIDQAGQLAPVTTQYTIPMADEVPVATVEGTVPDGYKMLPSQGSYDSDSRTYTIPIYNVADAQQKAADAVDQLAAAAKAATKTISVDIVDQVSHDLLDQSTYTVAKLGGIDLDEVLAKVPTGYNVNEAGVSQDPETGKYYIPVYKPEDLKAQADNALNQLTEAIKAATKTISVDIVDQVSHDLLDQSTYTVAKLGGISLDTVLAKVPTGYNVNEAGVSQDPETGKYYIPVYKPEDLKAQADNALNQLTEAIKGATKTISVDIVDQVSHDLLDQSTYTVAKLGGISKDTVLAKVPAGYTVNEAGAIQDPETGKYYIPVYKPEELKAQADNALNQLAEAIKAATKTITVKFVDRDTNAEFVTRYTIPVDSGVPMATVENSVPDGYRMLVALGTYDNETRTYTIPIYNVVKTQEKLTKAVDTFETAVHKLAKKSGATLTAPAVTQPAKHLPQTGDATNLAASGLGVLAVVGALFGLAGERRKHA